MLTKNALKSERKKIIFIKLILNILMIFTKKNQMVLVFFCYLGRGDKTHPETADKAREGWLGKC